MATLDLLSGQVTATKSVNGNMLLVKRIHGLINAVSWGILMPIGDMAARYMKTYEKSIINGIFVALVGALLAFLPKAILPRSSSKVYTPFLADPFKNITFGAYDTLTLLVLVMWAAMLLAPRRNRGRRLG
ncbi:unnamed protein product [Arabis nemorensis]|uniref:Uncharacterized protein n=1 Tax=Arabis nemorensis TaxID=586526 RepID=A0A565AXJ5_9BRAS|nr:unnamed protein product [Arabis nemorensis]